MMCEGAEDGGAILWHHIAGIGRGRSSRTSSHGHGRRAESASRRESSSACMRCTRLSSDKIVVVRLCQRGQKEVCPVEGFSMFFPRGRIVIYIERTRATCDEKQVQSSPGSLRREAEAGGRGTTESR